MRRRVAAERAVATISRTVPCARAARATDEPIRPTPINARRLKSGAGLITTSRRLGQKLFDRGDDETIGLFGADGHPQRIRQLVRADMTQDQPARHEEGVGFPGGTALRLRKMNKQKISDARGHFETELFELLRQPAEPARVVFPRALLVLVILDRRNPGGDRRRIDIEGAANAVDGGDDMSG